MTGSEAPPPDASSAPDPLSRPIFVVGPPGSGHDTLRLSLKPTPGTWGTLDLDEVLLPVVDDRQTWGDRLTARHADGHVPDLRAALHAAFATRDRRRVPGDAAPRHVSTDVRHSLRIPFLDAVFPDAMFVYLRRDPAVAVRESLDAWRTPDQDSFVPEGWEGVGWRPPLVPGWRDLDGLAVDELACEQWAAVARTALDDLEQIDGERWRVVDAGQLVAHPEAGLQDLFGFLGLGWHARLSTPWRELRDAAPAAGVGDLGDVVGPDAAAVVTAADERARVLVHSVDVSRSTEQGDTGRAVDADLSTVLADLSSSLLVTTYQSNRVIVMRDDGGTLGVRARTFDRPMGIAVTPGGVALGGHSEVYDFRDFPPAAAKLEPRGRHDACYLPRNLHVTGDIAVHDLDVADDGLWLVATKFSCLATLDSRHSFVPRWKPPFITTLAPEDRCHLNGMAVVDGSPRYVTALGTTDTAGGWRARKADGGVLMDVPSGEIVVGGLSMPHSPRWHGDRLWVLESGRGRLSSVDVEGGTTEAVIELPGFTRGLRFHGDTAFVGTSEIRETATFGGLPISSLPRRVCGVWAVDLRTGKLVGSMRFETRIQEVFDVAVLDGKRFPDILERSDPIARDLCHVPSVRGVTD